VVYGLYVLSSVNQLVATVAIAKLVSFARTWRLLRARQDHTTSPSANVPLVSRHIHVHRIPLHVRDDAYAPCRCGTQ
jgi:hypothetical protein